MSLIDLSAITGRVQDALENSPALEATAHHLDRMATALERLATVAEAGLEEMTSDPVCISDHECGGS